MHTPDVQKCVSLLYTPVGPSTTLKGEKKQKNNNILDSFGLRSRLDLLASRQPADLSFILFIGWEVTRIVSG